MRDLLREAIDEATLGTTVDDLLDFWHVLEKLAPAAQVIDGEVRGSEVLATWRLDLLNRRAAVDDILAALKGSGTRTVRVGITRPVHEAITYRENHRGMLVIPAPGGGGSPSAAEHGSDVQDALHSADEAKRRPMEGTDRRRCDQPARAGAQRSLGAPALQLTLAPLRKAVRPAA